MIAVMWTLQLLLSKSRGQAWLPRGQTGSNWLPRTSFVYHCSHRLQCIWLVVKTPARVRLISQFRCWHPWSLQVEAGEVRVFTSHYKYLQLFWGQKMKVFSFCCCGLRCLFRLIRGPIFRAFICRVLRLDKTDSVYQDCEDYDTKGMLFLCLWEKHCHPTHRLSMCI